MFRDCPCSLPKSVEQSVYLFSAAESSHDVIRGSLSMLIERGSRKEENEGTGNSGMFLPLIRIFIGSNQILLA